MQRTRWQTLALVATGVAALTWLGFSALAGRGGLPPQVPWLVAAVEVMIAAIVFVMGWAVRQFLRGKRPDLDPIRAARTAVLAKASCYTGALLAGWYGGQTIVHVHAFPFRMTKDNMTRHAKSQWNGFWRTLKEGYDYFEISRLPPKVAVCEKRYLINAAFNGNARPNPVGACPSYQKLPIPRAPAMQEASFKPKKNYSSLSKPLGSVLGLTFGPAKNNYRAFTLGPATPVTASG